MNEDEMMSTLSIPGDFIEIAEKSGWKTINFRISPNSVYLIQDEWRVRFVRGEEKKFWILEKSGEIGWEEAHAVFHPGSSRLEWVLEVFKKIMLHFEENNKA